MKYEKILVPLDGSKTAENVLPYARCFARNLQIPVELLGVVDASQVVRNISVAAGLFADTLIDDGIRRCGEYLSGIAKNFPVGRVRYRVEKGKPAEVIVELAAPEKTTLIAMATHGRSGVNRWLVGSVAEKVLRTTVNPLLLIRAQDDPPPWDMAALKSIVVPMDGSELAEAVLPEVEYLAKNLDLEVILLRAYAVPYGVYTAGEGFYDTANLQAYLGQVRAEAVEYLEKKTAALQEHGTLKVTYVAKEGLSADEIISFDREQPDNLIAMCTHGRSGVKRWALGSVTEAVVRHSDAPVLIVRGGA